MKELIAGESDGAAEKHVPEYKVEGNKVNVNIGSVDHPMVDAHWIEWVSLESKEGIQRKYAYCNLHGLWKA